MWGCIGCGGFWCEIGDCGGGWFYCNGVGGVFFVILVEIIFDGVGN